MLVQDHSKSNDVDAIFNQVKELGNVKYEKNKIHLQHNVSSFGSITL